jgi:hypothetical protein
MAYLMPPPEQDCFVLNPVVINVEVARHPEGRSGAEERGKK